MEIFALLVSNSNTFFPAFPNDLTATFFHLGTNGTTENKGNRRTKVVKKMKHNCLLSRAIPCSMDRMVVVFPLDEAFAMEDSML